MKVLDLQCAQHHAFEGWFASEDDFQSQLARRLVECPMCADTGITKMLSAPRLNLGAASDAPRDAAPVVSTPALANAAAPTAQSPEAKAQAAFLKAVRTLVARTEDVGARFADEARRMHYGETEERSIRGQASVRETVELLEEGIEVMPLPLLPALKQTLQ